jgi:hypothetical protein
MKRLFVLLAALAALSALAAGSAFAAGGTTTCTDGQFIQTTISNNLDVPAGVFCRISGEVKGNVTVEGKLTAFGALFDKNVTVSGGQFTSGNYGSTILGNLTITGSQGCPGCGDLNGFWLDYANSHVYGNVTLTGNVVPFYIQGTANSTPHYLIVDGNFTSSGTVLTGDQTLVHVGGTTNIS